MKGPLRLTRWVRVRIVGVAGILVLLFGAIAYRAYGLQIREAARYRELARRQHLAMIEVPAPRGAIYDARGAELAVSADVESVYANPQEVDDLGGLAEQLAALLHLDARELEARLDSPRYFVWVARHVAPEQARAVRDARLPGVYLTPEPRRFYPGRRLAGTVLGFAGIDGRGLDGIELMDDQLLTGRRASVAALRDARGTLMLSDTHARPRPGASVHLTIHRYVQAAAERALEKVVTEEQARAGVVVVLDVENGDVLAMAAWPAYDPNQPGADRAAGARNRAVTDVYEIGSIMKVFTIASALEARAVTPSTTFAVDGGRLAVGRKIIRDVDHDDVLDVGGILKRSSNVGAVKIARRLGRDAFHDALLRFGFGRKTGIDLPGEQPGLVRDPDRWGEIGLATMAFGYGLSVTPIQVAAAFAAIADGGVYHQPHVVSEVRAEGGQVVYQRPADPGRRVLSAETAAMMKPMLASVFDKAEHGGKAGTAHALDLPGFRAGGKTGTAHKIDPATGRYGDHLYLSSFGGFAPLEHPRVLVLALVDEPHGTKHFGAQVAGPLWVEVMSATMKYLGLPLDGATVAAGAPSPSPSTTTTTLTATATATATKQGAGEDEGDTVVAPDLEGIGDGRAEVIPDFVGLGMADALALAHERGIRVDVLGSGRAIGQFPPPGPADKPAECRIVFAHETRATPRSIP